MAGGGGGGYVGVHWRAENATGNWTGVVDIAGGGNAWEGTQPGTGESGTAGKFAQLTWSAQRCFGRPSIREVYPDGQNRCDAFCIFSSNLITFRNQMPLVQFPENHSRN